MSNPLKILLGTDATLTFWNIIVITSPFYIFPSGTPQPSDIALALLGSYILFSGKFITPPYLKKKLKSLLYLFIYLIVVNLVWYVILLKEYPNDTSLLLAPVFYGFNILNLIIMFALYSKYKITFLKSTLYAIIFGNLLLVALSPFAGSIKAGSDSMSRGALFFNNPNQLGYHVLLSTTIFLVLIRYFRVSIWIYILFMITSLYMASITVSKAAIFSILILFAINFITNFNRRLIALIPVSFLIIFFFFRSDMGQEYYEKFQKRVETSENLEVSEWENRGYDRMQNHPQYLILGAGEGAFKRFDTFIKKHEMHSSYGTILFSYGIPGFIFFAIFVVGVFKNLKLTTILYSIPILSYGFSHMGLRFTLFWTSLGMFAILGYEVFKKRKLAALKLKFHKKKIQTAQSDLNG